MSARNLPCCTASMRTSRGTQFSFCQPWTISSLASALPGFIYLRLYSGELQCPPARIPYSRLLPAFDECRPNRGVLPGSNLAPVIFPSIHAPRAQVGLLPSQRMRQIYGISLYKAFNSFIRSEITSTSSQCCRCFSFDSTLSKNRRNHEYLYQIDVD